MLYLQYSQSTWHYSESGYPPDTCGRANIDSYTLRVDANFLNLQQKVSGFNNTRIRVDGASKHHSTTARNKQKG